MLGVVWWPSAAASECTNLTKEEAPLCLCQLATSNWRFFTKEDLDFKYTLAVLGKNHATLPMFLEMERKSIMHPHWRFSS